MDAVPAAEWADPDEAALVDPSYAPAAGSFVHVVVPAGGGEVLGCGWSAQGVIA
jgi:hypothetical protein